MLSRICEEFGCLPSRAQWELEHDPEQWAVQILRLRAYARTKEAWDRATDEKARNVIPEGPMKDLVEEFTFEAVAVTQRERQAAAQTTEP